MEKLSQNSKISLSLLILRLGSGGILLYEGFLKVFLRDPGVLSGYFEGLGLPLPHIIASLVGFFELGAGLLIVLGLFTRIAASLAAGEMAVATLVANLPQGFTAATEVTILLFVVFLALALAGSGKFSPPPIKKLKTSSLVVIFLFIAALTVTSLTVFAAGGGGGGGGGGTPPPPSCTEDTWECTEWVECSVEGVQGRTCTLVNNCPTVEDPKPVESQACTPACTEDTWDCTEWNTCSLDGSQTRVCTRAFDCSLIETPKPIETQTCEPSCTEDKWSCTSYSICSKSGRQSRTCSLTFDCDLTETPKPTEARACTPLCTEDIYECLPWGQCQEDGREYRTCALANNCPGVQTPAPEESRVCPGIRCGHLGSLEERITCRIKLTDTELAQEFQILYFPEYCKVEETLSQKKECIELYQSLGPCWQIPVGGERTACARKVIGLGSIVQEKNLCLEQSGSSRAACVETLKDKIEGLVIFHMYELEVQAEALLKKGMVTEDEVAKLEVYIETKKQEIESAENVRNWKTIVRAVKTRWLDFTSKTR